VPSYGAELNAIGATIVFIGAPASAPTCSSGGKPGGELKQGNYSEAAIGRILLGALPLIMLRLLPIFICSFPGLRVNALDLCVLLNNSQK